MTRRLLLAVTVLFSAFASAQTVQPILQPHQHFVDNSGNPCAGCGLYTYAAGTTTPLATYTDASGATQNPNPVILDASGSAAVWTGLVSYKFVLVDTYGTTLWTVDQVISADCPLTGCTFAGPIGATYFSAADPPSFNPSQMGLNNTFNVGGINFQTEYQANQPGTYTTEGASFGLVVPASSTKYGSSTMGVYLNDASSTTNAVAGYYAARATGSGAHVWGINPLISDGAQNNVTGYGIEDDCNVFSATTNGSCFLINGDLIGHTTASFPAIKIASLNGKWSEDLQLVDGTGSSAIEIGALGTTASSNSMGVYYRSYNASDVLQEVGTYFGADGNFHFPAPLMIPAIVGANTVTFTNGSSIGTGGTASCYTADGGQCTATAGLIQISTGTSPGAGQLAILQFTNPLPNAVRCTVSGAGGTAAAALLVPYMGFQTVGQIILSVGSAPAASTSYQFMYTCGD